jgi:hypothetical protein
LYLPDEGKGDAVVGLALRFALNARPTGSQGSAPGKVNDKNKSKDQKKNKKNKKQKKGTF